MITKGQFRRNHLGLSIKEIARQSGISENYISNILHGRITPSRKTLEAIGKVLGLEPDEVQEPMDDVINN